MDAGDGLHCGGGGSTLEQLDLHLCGLLDDRASAPNNAERNAASVQTLQLSRRSLEAVLSSLPQTDDEDTAACDASLRRRAIRVTSNACGMIMSSIHTDAATRMGGDALLCGANSSFLVMKHECALLLTLLLCDVSNCTRLWSPSGRDDTTHQPSDGNPLSGDVREEGDLQHTIVACARALCRYLSVDVCSITLATRWPNLSKDGGGSEGASPDIGRHQSPRLWEQWLPMALRCAESRQNDVAAAPREPSFSNGRGDGATGAASRRTDEEYRLAVVMLDALRRWCLDTHDALQDAQDAAPAPSNDSAQSGGGAALPAEGPYNLIPDSKKGFHFWVVDQLARNVADIALPELRLARRATPSPRLGRTGVVALPINVLEGFVDAWSRLSQLLGPVACRVTQSPSDTSDAILTPPTLRGTGSGDQRPSEHHASPLSSVKRALAYHDPDEGGDGTTNASAHGAPLLPTVRAAKALPVTGVPSALKALLEQAPTDVLRLDDVRLAMAQYKREREVQLQDMRSMVDAVQAHNVVLANRIATRVVKTRLANCIVVAACGYRAVVDDAEGLADEVDDGTPRWVMEAVANDVTASRRLTMVERCLQEVKGSEMSGVVSHIEQLVVKQQQHRHPRYPSPSSVAATATTTVARGSGTDVTNTTPSVVARVRSSSAVETFNHDARLAREEEEVDRLARSVRTLTPRCRSGSRLHQTSQPLASQAALIHDGQRNAAARNNTDDALLFVSPLSDTNKSQ